MRAQIYMVKASPTCCEHEYLNLSPICTVSSAFTMLITVYFSLSKVINIPIGCKLWSEATVHTQTNTLRCFTIEIGHCQASRSLKAEHIIVEYDTHTEVVLHQWDTTHILYFLQAHNLVKYCQLNPLSLVPSKICAHFNHWNWFPKRHNESCNVIIITVMLPKSVLMSS